MAKSRLSTEEMRDLKNKGAPIKKIAEMAGTKKLTVKNRLEPERSRLYGRELYRNLQNGERRTYIDTQRNRNREAQDSTSAVAEKVGDPWTTKELAYLHKFGSIKTIEELAINLGRTFFAVSHAANRYKIPLRK